MTVPIREAALDRGQNGASNDNLCTSLWMRKSHGLRIQRNRGSRTDKRYAYTSAARFFFQSSAKNLASSSERERTPIRMPPFLIPAS